MTVDNRETDVWLHFDSVLYLRDWSEERLAHESIERTIKSLNDALNHGRQDRSFSCSVQTCKSSKDALKKGAWAVYGYHVVYDAHKPTVAIGIRRLLTGMCYSCIQDAPRAERRSLEA